jgi:hypothetical protein
VCIKTHRIFLNFFSCDASRVFFRYHGKYIYIYIYIEPGGHKTDDGLSSKAHRQL